ncbi:ROK family transcriptional regulator [Sanguibacter sp. A247]|uniref:ROK family transcriptional regulator n=1 Tax=unclassified Sanguibacter TaxID=2645534 RepID=UPI003FD7A023
MSIDRQTPGSQTSLREANRARVLHAVQQRGALTQVELAGVTGLSPATVSNIVKELTAAGVLATAPTSRSGRRAQQVTLARSLGLVAGVHFGFRTLRVALADTAHRVVAEVRMPLPPDHRADFGLDRVVMVIDELLEQVDASRAELLRVGVAVAAPVDPATGTVSTRGLLRGWDGVSVPDVLAAELAVPVHVDNDANLGALAEHRSGAARGRDNAVYVRISHGVGAGLVLGGRLHRGRAGAAGEIGHVSIDENGAVCRCGNRGCLEMYVASAALIAVLAPSHGHLSLSAVLERAAAGDPGCSRVVEDAGRHLGAAVATLCTTLDPDVVVIGGPVAGAGEILLGPLRSVLARRAFPTFAGAVDVVVGELGPEAELRGALLLALDHVNFSPALGGS